MYKTLYDSFVKMYPFHLGSVNVRIRFRHFITTTWTNKLKNKKIKIYKFHSLYIFNLITLLGDTYIVGQSC